ncbi:hypothetical protein KQH82_11375 [bacterium]|nr:hypothetical protein [bacterium]
MRGSRVSAFLVLLAFVAAFVISAPMLVAEHAWDADATGGSTTVNDIGNNGGYTAPDSISNESGGGTTAIGEDSSSADLLDQVMFQLWFLVSGGGV